MVVLFLIVFVVLTRSFWVKFFRFLRYVVQDTQKAKADRKQGIVEFDQYGVKMFCGRQGYGKTIGIVWYLEGLRAKYPNLQIYTNFGYTHEDGALTGLNDLLVYRNGTDGVVFAIDEIQNEFSSAASRNFPESMLSTITMQRKQRVTILCSSQVFARAAKPLREQCYEVVECHTLAKRWTFLECFDAEDYNRYVDRVSEDNKAKVARKWRNSFVQSDELRGLYDTYQVVQRLSRDGFKTRVSVSDV
ncbi:MAG: hypothetical protein PHR41_09370 [Lactococcus chungangensis]|nr:hypothetical protein [Lactococcus chungangensis]